MRPCHCVQCGALCGRLTLTLTLTLALTLKAELYECLDADSRRVKDTKKWPPVPPPLVDPWEVVLTRDCPAPAPGPPRHAYQPPACPGWETTARTGHAYQLFCVAHVPEAQGSLPWVEDYCTYGPRVPASGDRAIRTAQFLMPWHPRSEAPSRPPFDPWEEQQGQSAPLGTGPARPPAPSQVAPGS